MKHDIFVSYSSKDKAVADAVVASLEQKNFRCWYAPRDIKPSEDWGDSITKAINDCKMVLLIFSGNANQSQRVRDEIYYAISEEKVILPFRIENLDPTGAMRLHLSSRHWLDAYHPSWRAHLERLVSSVADTMGRPMPQLAHKVESEAQVTRTAAAERKKVPWLWIGLTVVMVTGLSVAGVLWFVGREGIEDLQVTALAQVSNTASATRSPTQTQTQTLTKTQNPSLTPTPRSSETPRPTQTAFPAWVDEFSQPILEMISESTPNVESNFEQYPSWLKFGNCPDYKKPKIVDGELVWTGCEMKWSMWYADFVIEMDIRHMINQNRWFFFFRSGAGYTLYPEQIERVEPDGDVVDDVLIQLTEPYQLRILVQGYETALFVNDQPLLYGSLPVGYKNGEASWFMGALDTSVAFDNIRIWNLNDLK